MSEPNNSKPYILCADDDAELLDTLETLLRRLFPDHPVASAFSYQDALSVAKRLKEQGQQVSLIVADQLMGDGTGTQLLTALQSVFPDASKAILTGHPALESAVEGLRQGIDVYLEKPVTEPELGRALRPLIERFHLRRQQSRLLQSTRETTRQLSQLLDLVLESLDGPVHTLLTQGADTQPARNQVTSGQRNIRLLSTAFQAHQQLWSDNPDRFTIQQLLGDSRKFVEGWQEDGLQIDNRLKIELKEHGGPQHWVGNRQLCRLVIERILHNAWRYAPTDTPIVVQTWPPSLEASAAPGESPFPLELLPSLRQGRATISISNEGRLSPENHQRITQALSPGINQGPLTGFGLVVSKQLLEAMGGHLHFTGKPEDLITTFHVLLPVGTQWETQAQTIERGARHDH